MSEGRPASVARGFLFADLRNWSAWVEAHGDHAAAELLHAYRELVRKAVAEADGAEIRTEGDSFYVAFGAPSAAVACGLRILELAQESTAAAGKPIAVGIGIHAGETVETEDGYIGSAVNVAARICAQAAAGELLVSDAVRSLTKGYLDVAFVPRGRKALKGIGEEIALFRVEPLVGGVRLVPKTRRRYARGPLAIIAGAVGIAIIVVGIALVGGALVREGVAGESPTAPAAAASSLSTLGASPSPPVSSDSAFPTEAESRLLARLDESIARHCQRADPAEVPVFDEAEQGLIPLAYDAGLECQLGSSSEPDEVWYWSAVTGQGSTGQRVDRVSGLFFQRVGRHSIPQGDCATDDYAFGKWKVGLAEGNLLCYGSRNATLVWTYDDEIMFATAFRSDGDMRALMTWWRDHAVLSSN